MIIQQMNANVRAEMTRGELIVESLQPKKDGAMMQIRNKRTQRILKLKVIHPRLTDPDFDFDSALLKHLNIWRAINRYGQKFFIVQTATFDTVINDQAMTCTVEGDPR